MKILNIALLTSVTFLNVSSLFAQAATHPYPPIKFSRVDEVNQGEQDLWRAYLARASSLPQDKPPHDRWVSFVTNMTNAKNTTIPDELQYFLGDEKTAQSLVQMRMQEFKEKFGFNLIIENGTAFDKARMYWNILNKNAANPDYIDPAGFSNLKGKNVPDVHMVLNDDQIKTATALFNGKTADFYSDATAAYQARITKAYTFNREFDLKIDPQSPVPQMLYTFTKDAQGNSFIFIPEISKGKDGKEVLKINLAKKILVNGREQVKIITEAELQEQLAPMKAQAKAVAAAMGQEDHTDWGQVTPSYTIVSGPEVEDFKRVIKTPNVYLENFNDGQQAFSADYTANKLVLRVKNVPPQFDNGKKIMVVTNSQDPKNSAFDRIVEADSASTLTSQEVFGQKYLSIPYSAGALKDYMMRLMKEFKTKTSSATGVIDFDGSLPGLNFRPECKI